MMTRAGLSSVRGLPSEQHARGWVTVQGKVTPTRPPRCARKQHQASLLAGMLLILVFYVPRVAVGQEANPCAGPDLLVERGRLETAEQAYIELILSGEGVQCALDGLGRIDQVKEELEEPAARPCEVANALRAAGRLDDAEAAYVEEMKNSEGRTCAARGLKRIESLRSGRGIVALDIIHFSGVNATPSLFSRWTALIIWIGILVALAAVLTLSFRLSPESWHGTLARVAVIGAGVALLTAARTDWGARQPESWAHVRVDPVKIPLQVGIPREGQVGLVQSEGGGVGAVVVRSKALDIDDVSSAGKYSGQVDLLPDRQGGTVKVDLAVRDWVLYALIAVAVGVGIGWWITHYYRQNRVEWQVRVRCDELWEGITELEAGLSSAAAGSPAARYSLLELARARLREVDGLLGKDDQASVTAANAKLDELDKNRSAFADLVRAVPAVLRAVAELQAQVEASAPPVGPVLFPGEIASLVRANEVLAGRSFSAEGSGPGEVALAATAAVDASLWLGAVTGALGIVRGYLASAWVKRLTADKSMWSDAELLELDTSIDSLAKARRDVLRAGKDGVATALTSAATAWETYLALVWKAEKQAPVPEEQVATGVAVLGMQAGSVDRAAARDVTVGTPAARLLGRDVDAPLSGSYTVSEGDLVAIAVEVRVPDAGGGGRSVTVHWGFDDGTRTVGQRLEPGASETVVAKRAFDREGPHRAFLIVNSVERASLTLDVRGAARLARGRAAFRIAESRATLVSGALAVASGVLVLYFASTTWGSGADYLKAVLWGSTVSEGLKLAGSLAARTWLTP